MGLKIARFRVLASCMALVLALPLHTAYGVDPAPAPSPSPTAPRSEPPKVRIKREESVIPKKTTAPPTLGVTKSPPTDVYRCPRNYVYRGKSLNCDSNLGWDGENLRPIIQDTPQAIAELDTYQHNRDKVQTLRYVGTAGLMLMATGFILGKTLDSSNQDRIAYRNLGVIGGSVMLTGSFLWGLTIIKGNEAHLGRAAERYNQAHPKDPIELQFSTGLNL